MKAKSECCEKHMFMNLSCLNKLSNLISKVFSRKVILSRVQASGRPKVPTCRKTFQLLVLSSKPLVVEALSWGFATFPKSINCQHILPTANPNKNKRFETDQLCYDIVPSPTGVSNMIDCRGLKTCSFEVSLSSTDTEQAQNRPEKEALENRENVIIVITETRIF